MLRSPLSQLTKEIEMITLVAVVFGAPCLGVLAFLGMRRIQSLPFARSLALARSGDMRGIALQTIIIMVVLLAIAGSVATVLLSRAGEETDRLGEEVDRWSDIDNPTGCEIAGGQPDSDAGTDAIDPLNDARDNMAICRPPA